MDTLRTSLTQKRSLVRVMNLALSDVFPITYGNSRKFFEMVSFRSSLKLEELPVQQVPLISVYLGLEPRNLAGSFSRFKLFQSNPNHIYFLEIKFRTTITPRLINIKPISTTIARKLLPPADGAGKSCESSSDGSVTRGSSEEKALISSAGL